MTDQATRIIAIRHGETAWNVGGRIQGHLDIALNDVGRWQAQRLAEAVAHEAIDAVYASDLVRAFDTAQVLADTRGQSVLTEVDLRERHFGEFQGQTFEEISLKWPQQAERWRKRDPDFQPGGGESLRQFYTRCVGAATRLAARHPGQTIALVAHGGVMDCLYRAAARVDLQAARSWLLGNASINRLLHSAEGFTLVGWSDVAHLGESLDENAPGDRVGSAA